MQTYAHPRSGTTIEGLRLVSGALTRRGDMYDSSDGKWREFGYADSGRVPEGDHVIWVRPCELSANAVELLKSLAARSGHVAGELRGWKIIPSRTWSAFTASANIATPPVMHPECVQELADVGYLSYDANLDVYSVTEAGKQVASANQ
jgi:hypothetical protein